MHHYEPLISTPFSKDISIKVNLMSNLCKSHARPLYRAAGMFILQYHPSLLWIGSRQSPPPVITSSKGNNTRSSFCLAWWSKRHPKYNDSFPSFKRVRNLPLAQNLHCLKSTFRSSHPRQKSRWNFQLCMDSTNLRNYASQS